MDGADGTTQMGNKDMSNNVPLEMQVSSHGLQLREAAQKAISRGASRLDSWTRKFPSRSGRITISRRDRDGVHRVELILELPHKTLVAHDEVPNLITAIDRAFRKMTRQLREFKAVLRREHMHNDVRESRQTTATVTEAEISGAARRRDLEEFKGMAAEHLTHLQRYLKREVNALRRRYPGVRFSVPDLVEETLAVGLERFDDKPHAMSATQWLYGVALEIVERRALNAHPDASESAAQIDSDTFPASRDLVEDLLEEFLVNSEVREDHTGASNDTIEDHFVEEGPEDPALAAEHHDLQDRVMHVLAELPMSWRRSFMLHFVEGFDFQEIAQLHNVSDDQIRFQVQSAELFLRERLAELAFAR